MTQISEYKTIVYKQELEYEKKLKAYFTVFPPSVLGIRDGLDKCL